MERRAPLAGSMLRADWIPAPMDVAPPNAMADTADRAAA